MKLCYMLWRDMICNRQPCVYTICLINKMNRIKSANVMSLCMIRRHYIDGTICARHIMKIFIPGTFYNPPNWQVIICVNIAVRTISNNQSCGVLKTWLARNNLHKLRTRHAN